MKPVETNESNNYSKERLPIPIAIVGIGSIFPEAQTVGEFWENILSRKNSIKEIVDREPEYYDGYWRMDEYFNSDPATSDRTYGKTGAFFPEVEFDPIEFGIPPINLESISTVQIMALLVAKQALADAGYTRDESTALLRDKTGVILGVGGSGNIAFTLAARTDAPRWEKVIKNFGFPDEMVTSIVEKLKSLYANWRESSFPGLLANVVSGRITSHFDLGGTNCTIDAACASSLAAIKMAIAELTDGSCDAVLTGGVNVDNSIVAYMCFSKTPALSREGLSRPFDADSDGIVLGDGVGMVVLKRLEDAERDGSKIYGVIRSIGTSSDGRAKSIYAPRFEGQVKALNRAYQQAGLTPKDIQLVEAHGTGTVAGDICEFKSIASVYHSHQVAKESVALGSVKSQIGHTRTAAGAASLIKATLALYNKILPPTINVTQPNPQFELENSSFYLNTSTRPWIQPPDKSKRRAALSSFGFGGTNFHMVLEEYQKEHEAPYRTHNVPDIVIVQASNRGTLIATCEELLEKFKSSAGKNCYHHYLNDSRHQKIPVNSARIGFVSESLEQTIEYLKESLLMLAQAKDYWQHPKGIYYRTVGMDLNGKVVALFPGQGSQYVNMAAELANNYPQMRQVLSDMNQILYQQNQPIVSDIIYPRTTFNQDKKIKQEQELLKTENAQPAIGAISAGIYKILQKAGFKPDFIMGHSFGELTALWASGVLSDEAFYHLAIARGRAMSFENNSGLDSGLMLAVNANEQKIKDIIDNVADIKITNYNSNSQVVLGGSKQSIKALHEVFQSQGIKSIILNVSNAFHTDFVSHASKPFAQSIALTDFELPSIPVYSNVTARPYPHNTDKIKKILAGHLVSSVAFRQGIELIYNQGGSVFIEIGPKKVLTNFVSDILRDKEHIAVALNPGLTANSEYEFRRSIVQLLVAGLDIENIDPYQMPKPIEQPKSKRGLPITLNGGVYLNPQTLELRQSSLLQRDTTMLDALIKQQIHSR